MAETSPAHRPPATMRTPVSPRGMGEETKERQDSASSPMPSVTPMTPLRPSARTPMATGALTFPTAPPQPRSCHTPSMDTYG